MRTVVVIPTYNERENLPVIVGRVRAAIPAASVMIVDDNSPDGTGRLADELAAADSQVLVKHRTGKEGLGRAYLDAFAQALDAGFEVIVQMDADLSHQPEDLPALLAGLESGGTEHPVDLVIGSRWVPGGKIVNWPWHRILISRGGSWYARTMLRVPTRDATAGFRAWRASALQSLPLDAVQTKGYGFQVDMLWQAFQAGLRVVEVPITFIERVVGTSKMSTKIVIEAMLQVTQWGLAARFGKRAPK
ncbi:MAG TPA: polyprenol monophosphomannose synthase [Candidatus Lumbricidophila sp.]|nr:polyprenol monophosphomannose synthase [Candidatus Lumbricidophila sp.]